MHYLLPIQMSTHVSHTASMWEKEREDMFLLTYPRSRSSVDALIWIMRSPGVSASLSLLFFFFYSYFFFFSFAVWISREISTKIFDLEIGCYRQGMHPMDAFCHVAFFHQKFAYLALFPFTQFFILFMHKHRVWYISNLMTLNLFAMTRRYEKRAPKVHCYSRGLDPSRNNLREGSSQQASSVSSRALRKKHCAS